MELTKSSSPADVRKEWCKALRSGSYPQGFIFLKADSKCGQEFCAFGVLGELGVKAGVIPEPIAVPAGKVSMTDTTYQYGPEVNHNFHIPDVIKEWAGVGDFFVADVEELNDTGKTFDQLAVIIEKEREAFK